jgi:RND family efflux transporter MFP subunit
MKRSTLVAAGVTAAAVLAAVGGYAWSAANSHALVGTAAVVQGPLEVSVKASGSLVAAHALGVYPPAAGTVAKVRVTDGQAVEKGQVLAGMDRVPLRFAVEQARATRTAARAQLQAVEDGVPTAIDRSAADAALTAARSLVATSRHNYAAFAADYRDASGAEKRSMRPTLRTLRTAKAQAAASLQAAEAGFARLSTAGRVTLARRAAEQAVTAAERALTIAQAHLDGSELTAPITGTVAFVGTVEHGSGLVPGVAAFTVTDPGGLAFDAAVDQDDVAAVATDQPVTLSLDSYPTRAFTGAVTRVAAAAETTSTGGVAFAVRIGFEAGDARLLQGMTGSVGIVVEQLEEVLTVPVESVVAAGDSQVVFVVGDDSVVQRRPVRIGASTDAAVQVLSGVAAGDLVVTTGATGLVDGQQVRLA